MVQIRNTACGNLTGVGRTRWTDERLDDLSDRMDAGFARVDADIRDVKSTMESRFNAVDARFTSLESRITWFDGGLMLTMFGVIVSNVL